MKFCSGAGTSSTRTDQKKKMRWGSWGGNEEVTSCWWMGWAGSSGSSELFASWPSIRAPPLDLHCDERRGHQFSSPSPLFSCGRPSLFPTAQWLLPAGWLVTWAESRAAWSGGEDEWRNAARTERRRRKVVTGFCALFCFSSLLFYNCIIMRELLVGCIVSLFFEILNECLLYLVHHFYIFFFNIPLGTERQLNLSPESWCGRQSKTEL